MYGNHGAQHLGSIKGDYPVFGKSLPTNMTTGNANRVSGMQTVFPVASVYTLQFNVTPPPFPTFRATPDFRCEAIVNWVVDGNYVSRRVSVINGMSISGVGQGVNIQYEDRSTGFAVGGVDYKVTASVTPGPRSSFPTFPVLLAQSFTALDPLGVLGPIVIPEDAGAIAVQVLAVPPAAGAFPARVSVHMITQAGTSISRFDPALNNGWIPLFPGTRALTIVNLDAANTVGVSAVYGIDG